jgi:hypothetical protein
LHRGAPLQYVYGSARTGTTRRLARRTVTGRGGKSDSELLIKSEPPERKPRNKSGNLESTEEIGTGNGLIESETQDRREAPGGKPERVSRVSTKEASVP